MKKKLLSILFPVIIAIACSVAVWANEQSATPPACDKCVKANNATPPACDKCVKANNATPPACDKCVKANSTTPPACDKCVKANGNAPCEKCATNGKATQVCDNCMKMKAAEGMPCGMGGGNCAKMQQTEKKPCCDKAKAL